MVGFEPTGRFTDQTISSRSRYDLFDTSPNNLKCPCKTCTKHLTILLYHFTEQLSSVFYTFPQNARCSSKPPRLKGAVCVFASIPDLTERYADLFAEGKGVDIRLPDRYAEHQLCRLLV